MSAEWPRWPPKSGTPSNVGHGWANCPYGGADPDRSRDATQDRWALMTPAQERLILTHRHLVRWAIGQMPGTRRYRDQDALVGAGNLGLVQAAAAYDPARGVPFFGYAHRRIRGAVIDEMRCSYDAARSVWDDNRAVDDATDRHYAAHGREPTDPELAAALGWTTRQLDGVKLRAAQARIKPLDVMLAAGLQVASDASGPEHVFEERDFQAAVQAALRQLPPNHRAAFHGVYFQNRLMADIGEELQLTPSRVSQLVAEAVKKLGRMLEPHIKPERGDRTRHARMAA